MPGASRSSNAGCFDRNASPRNTPVANDRFVSEIDRIVKVAMAALEKNATHHSVLAALASPTANVAVPNTTKSNPAPSPAIGRPRLRAAANKQVPVAAIRSAVAIRTAVRLLTPHSANTAASR